MNKIKMCTDLNILLERPLFIIQWSISTYLNIGYEENFNEIPMSRN